MIVPARAPKRFVLAALSIFALSGCAGLIYQSIWTQYLGLFLGHAAYAQSLVLSIFMGGMAIGAWWASAKGLHWRSLLRAYAWIELAIGIAAALFHSIFGAATSFAYGHAFPALGGGVFAEWFKWILAAALICPQAILLGTTFPLMSNGVIRRIGGDSGGNVLSGLYFSNSIGAALGAIIATFLLLPAVGLPGAMQIGAALNIVVALAALWLARGEDAPIHGAAEPAPVESAVASMRMLLGAALVTGLTSFVYEVGWVRMLCLVFGSSVHAFELMLAAFIGGLAFGALYIRRRIDALALPARTAGYVQVLMGLAALLSLWLYDHAFDATSWFMGALSKTYAGYDLFNVMTAVGAIVIMAPTAFFAGMTLPLFTLAMMRSGGGEASVGRIYAANTVGAIVGVFLTMHVLLPGVGLKLSMVAAAAGDLVLGLFLLRVASNTAPRRTYLAAAALCAVALMATLIFARFDPMAMAAGVFRHGLARFDPQNSKVVFYRDGKTASVSATATENGWVLIATNGKADASIQVVDGRPPSLDEVTMVMAAALPLSLHPAPHSAAVIGFGSGLTTHTLLSDKRLERVDTIEIEPAMYEGARVYGEHVERAYRDPRSHIHFDDAKAYFATNSSRYDIIVSEPSNPWVSGVANLFSEEFYRFVPRHLKPKGILVQWMQQYSLNDELVATVAHALAGSFPDFRIYMTNNYDILIVASADGPIGDIDEAVLKTEPLAHDATRVGLGTKQDLQLHQVGDRSTLMPLFNILSGRTNSDFHPILSLEAPRARYVEDRASSVLDIAAADQPLREVLLGMQPPADPASVALNPDFQPTVLLRQADEIAKSLQNGGSAATAMDTDLSALVVMARTSVGECDSSNATQQVDVLVQLAAKTMPFADPSHLAGVWSSPRWIRCDKQPAVVRDVLALLDVQAQRDFAAVSTRTPALLEKYSTSLSPMAQDWLYRAALLALIAQHDYAGVAVLDASLGRKIRPTTNSVLQREYLLSFAREHTP